jgi:thioesterase domain-containing protein
MRLWARIKETFGLNLPISVFFRHPTVEELAAFLTDQAASAGALGCGDFAPAGTQAGPLFCVNLWPALAKQMPDSFIYPLGFWSDEHLIWDLDSLEERVKPYLERLREHQPKGPYRLFGGCASASFAFEMARQLEEQGEDVPLVILVSPREIRSASRRSDPWWSIAWRFNLHRFRHHLREMTRVPVGSWPSYWFQRATTVQRRLAIRAKLAPSSLDRSAFWRVRPQLRKAIFNYTPEYYPGKVTVILPKERVDIYKDADFGWGSVAGGGVDVHIVPGDHPSLFRGEGVGVQYVAEAVRNLYHESCRNQSVVV